MVNDTLVIPELRPVWNPEHRLEQPFVLMSGPNQLPAPVPSGDVLDIPALWEVDECPVGLTWSGCPIDVDIPANGVVLRLNCAQEVYPSVQCRQIVANDLLILVHIGRHLICKERLIAVVGDQKSLVKVWPQESRVSIFILDADIGSARVFDDHHRALLVE